MNLSEDEYLNIDVFQDLVIMDIFQDKLISICANLKINSSQGQSILRSIHLKINSSQD